MILNQKRLLDRLTQLGIISMDVAEEVKLEESLVDLEAALIERGVINREDLTKIKGEILNVPYMDLRDKKIAPDIFDVFPMEIIRSHGVIVFDKSGSEIGVGMVDPQNFKSIQAIEFLIKKSRLKVKYFIISEDSFKEAVKKNSTIGEEVEKALDIAETKYTEATQTAPKLEDISEVETVKGAPISKIVSVIIRHAVEGGASDIHIEPTPDSSKIRYRVDGILHTSLTLPQHVHSAIISRIKIMANLKIDETRIPQDGRIRLTIDNRQIDFRVSIFPLLDSEKAVLRVLDTLSGIISMSDLGFNKIHQEIIIKNIKSTDGMLLLTGPTGSGKTTTLYSILDILNKDGVNIITLEDPVEYFIGGINQSQIKPDVGYTFASGLRSILRQDPDIIMVGEIRDGETAELAIHASLTGHFVLSTLHTNSAVGSLPRLIDMGVEPFLLASTVRVVLAQRLVRKVCQNCRAEYEVGNNMKQEILNELSEIPKIYLKETFQKDISEISIEDIKLYKGKGCEECGGEGFKSRIVVAELLVITDEIKNIVSMGYNEGKINEYLKSQDMISLREDGILKALKGLTTIEEVFRVVRG